MKAWRRRAEALEARVSTRRRNAYEPASVEQMNMQIRWGMMRLGIPIPDGVDEHGVIDLNAVDPLDLAHLEIMVGRYREEVESAPWLDGIEGLAWLGLPGLAVTVANFDQFCQALTSRQMAAFRSHLAGEWCNTGPQKTPLDEPDIEIQAELMRAGHLRLFPRLPSREIDLSQLTDAELAVLYHGDPE